MFHNVLRVFHDVSLVVHDVLLCKSMFNNVLLCLGNRLRDRDNAAGIDESAAEIGNGAAGGRDRRYRRESDPMPRWKINSFLSEISVCWRCMEKITFQIERAFSVILRASSATRRSSQPSPQHPTVAAENLRFNTPLATANARWHLPSHTIVDCIADSSAVSTVC